MDNAKKYDARKHGIEEMKNIIKLIDKIHVITDHGDLLKDNSVVASEPEKFMGYTTQELTKAIYWCKQHGFDIKNDLWGLKKYKACADYNQEITREKDMEKIFVALAPIDGQFPNIEMPKENPALSISLDIGLLADLCRALGTDCVTLDIVDDKTTVRVLPYNKENKAVGLICPLR